MGNDLASLCSASAGSVPSLAHWVNGFGIATAEPSVATLPQFSSLAQELQIPRDNQKRKKKSFFQIGGMIVDLFYFPNLLCHCSLSFLYFLKSVEKEKSEQFVIT